MEDKVLHTVVDSIKFKFEKDFLVKPLEPVKIEQTITKQIPTGKKDKDGNQMYDTKEEKEMVESDFGKGVVLSIPTCYTGDIIPGSIIVYPKKFAKRFDLFKDSELVRPYDIVAIEKK